MLTDFLPSVPEDAPGRQVSVINTPEGNYLVKQGAGLKTVSGPGYNSWFDVGRGFFARWGEAPDENPAWAPPGPELLDLEISVNGCPNNCCFCYKSNSDATPTNMSLETFRQVLDRMPDSLTQIAFGITGVQTNPDFIEMLRLTRERGIVPNFTLSGKDLTYELAEEISKHVGGLAVSLYQGQLATGLRAVKWFKELGVEQTNAHLMLSTETEQWVRFILSEAAHRQYPDLANVNAFVFLGLKPVGRAKQDFHPLPYSKFASFMQYALIERAKPVGFDSCTAPFFERFVKECKDLSTPQRENFLQQSESCESGIMSAYINVAAEYFPCSFSEAEEQGMNVLDYPSFLDIWHSPELKQWRKRLSAKTNEEGTRSCPLFDLYQE